MTRRAARALAAVACAAGLLPACAGSGSADAPAVSVITAVPIHAPSSPERATSTTAPEVASAPPPAGTQPPTTAPEPVAPTTAVAPTTTSIATPTIAEQYTVSVLPVGIEVMSTPVPVQLRDSLARQWLLLGRLPSAEELRGAADAVIVRGSSLTDVAGVLLASPERAVPATDSTPDVFVAGLYERVLGRTASADEVAVWAGRAANGMAPAALAVEFTESAEAVARTTTSPPGDLPTLAVDGASRGVSDSVLRLYLGLLRRFPSPAELSSGVERYVAGIPLATLAAEVLASAERVERRPDTSPDALVAALYEDVLGRAPDEGGRIVWTGRLAGGDAAGVVAASFTESPEAVARTATAAPEAPPPPPSAGSSSGSGAGGPSGSGSAGSGGAGGSGGSGGSGGTGGSRSSGVYAIGDSVMAGAVDELRAAIPGITVDASISRQFSDGVAVVRSLADQGRLPRTVVVHLGTNGSVGSSRCDELVRAAGDSRVVLVNNRVPRSWETSNNRVLASCAARNGAALVDWFGNASGLEADGVHVTRSGARRYASLIASAV